VLRPQLNEKIDTLLQRWFDMFASKVVVTSWWRKASAWRASARN
jgi:hypothetical protein